MLCTPCQVSVISDTNRDLGELYVHILTIVRSWSARVGRASQAGNKTGGEGEEGGEGE